MGDNRQTWPCSNPDAHLAHDFCPGRNWVAEAPRALCDPDSVNHPPHYSAHPSGVECIQITEHMNFNIGNAVKYLWRADEKGNAVEDLAKAEWYVHREIERRAAQ